MGKNVLKITHNVRGYTYFKNKVQHSTVNSLSSRNIKPIQILFVPSKCSGFCVEFHGNLWLLTFLVSYQHFNNPIKDINSSPEKCTNVHIRKFSCKFRRFIAPSCSGVDRH